MRIVAALASAIAASMFLSAQVYADPAPQPTDGDPRPAIVQLFMDPQCNQTPVGDGTGFVTAMQPLQDGLNLITIYTAHHVTRDMPCLDIRWYGDQMGTSKLDPHKMQLVHTKAIHFIAYANDVFSFQVVSNHVPESLVMGSTLPAFAAPITAVGFPGASAWFLVTGNIAGDADIINIGYNDYPAIPVTTTSGFYPGLSGSPVFDASGDVFAIADACDVGPDGINHGYVVLLPGVN